MFKELSTAEIEQIKTSTEDILETTGFRVMHRELLRRSSAAGADVDETKGIVRIPRALLRELLARVPRTYEVSGAGGARHTVGGSSQHCLAIVTDPWIVDYETRRPRRPCLDDLRRHTIIAQKLDEVFAISRMDFPVSDAPGPASSLRALEEHLLNHDKHIFCVPASPESYAQWFEIGRILMRGKDLAGSRIFSIMAAVVSPLTLTEFNGDLLLSACEHDFPFMPTVCPMAGSTSPYTLSSTLLQGNAETIFMAALSQIVRPGNPFLYAWGPSVTNMRSGDDMYYTLDKVLWKMAGVQVAKSYGIPVLTECGGTMTFRYDQQNGAEGMLFMLAACASGANVLSGIGSCYNAVGMSAEMMLVQTAWLGAARYLVAGMNTGADRLGLENIKDAGPGGNFLTDDLTLRFFRGGEFFHNDLFDFAPSCDENSSLLARAHKKAEEMVAGFEPPVPGKVRDGLRSYFRDEYKKLEC